MDLLNSQVAFAKKKAIGTFNIVHLFQPIPTIFSQHSKERGGNILGLDRAKDNLICTSHKAFQSSNLMLTQTVFQANLAWKNSKDDALFDGIGQSTIDQLSKYAKSINKDFGYIYLDYAYKTQDPIGSYGADNVRFLKTVAKKYDPEGVFQTLVPGGFKLSSAGS